MREWNLLRSYPQPDSRKVGDRTIGDRILACYRGRDFYDGPRSCGYGGYINDGRWGAVATDVVNDYYPLKRVLQLNCDKGFLVHELEKQGVSAFGVESSSYARAHGVVGILPSFNPEWIQNPFDLVIAIGLIYTMNLSNAMEQIRVMERMGHKNFITLATYRTKEDYWLFKKWSLLATLILKREEWLEVLKHCGYTGDYWFVDAESLRLE